MERCKADPENTQNFLDVFIGRWDLFLDYLEIDPCEKKVILGSGEYLSDYFKYEVFMAVQILHRFF